MAAVAAWGAMVGVLAVARPAGDGLGACLFHAATGVPCPTCGSTRAVKALASGDLAGAVAFNPLAVATLMLGPIVLLHRAGRRRPRAAAAGGSGGRIPAPVLIVAAVLANWAYILAAR